MLEEAAEYLRAMRARKLDTVFLAAPTSPDERLRRIAEASSGFVYAVSRTGVTGARQEVARDARELVKRLRRFTKLPVAVGFGVSNAEQFAEVGEYADAVVVGSAIVERVANAGRAGAAEARSQLPGDTQPIGPADQIIVDGVKEHAADTQIEEHAEEEQSRGKDAAVEHGEAEADAGEDMSPRFNGERIAPAPWQRGRPGERLHPSIL